MTTVMREKGTTRHANRQACLGIQTKPDAPHRFVALLSKHGRPGGFPPDPWAQRSCARGQTAISSLSRRH